MHSLTVLAPLPPSSHPAQGMLQARALLKQAAAAATGAGGVKSPRILDDPPGA